MSREGKSPAVIEGLRREFEGLATVLAPDEAEPPVLAATMRAAVFGWLQELGAAKELAHVGVKPRKRLLLEGPPGCGKTTLAHHVAQRLGLPIIIADTAMMSSSYMGETGRNVARLFDLAAAVKGGVVLFLDEIDALAEKRNSQGTGASKDLNKTVIALMARLDGYTGIVAGATNRADMLDQAVWRRFDMQMKIDLPDDEARYAILVRYFHPFVAADECLDTLTDWTAGATPALMRQLVEGIKRELVIGPKHKADLSAPAIFGRLTATVRAAEGLATPPLWHATPADLAELPWPPERPS